MKSPKFYCERCGKRTNHVYSGLTVINGKAHGVYECAECTE